MPNGLTRSRGGRGTGVRRGAVVGALALVTLIGTAGGGLAVPPPPPNPSDSELDSSRGDRNARAGEVGQLTNQLAEAESRLSSLQADVELKMEQANKARVDMQMARETADQAERDAVAARTEADAASGAIEQARTDLDSFVAGSYRQGSTIGSIGAYLGSDSPDDLLARAQLLEAVSGSQLDALEGMHQAQVEKSNKDAAARQALEEARQRRTEAEQARVAADEAQAAAVEAQQGQAARNSEIESEKSRVEQLLYAAQSEVDGLEGQRARYNDWVAQKQAEEEERAREAALAASSNSSGSSGSSAPVASPPSAPAGASVEAAVARAMSQLGVQYAWGGGNTAGPTYGIRDGGVADSYGDYNKIGFDCSGLMIYAFAGVTSLPHYSGYQYEAGYQVPLSQMRRGDMLFWGTSGIHHVAMYLGGGQMIEAPYSGGYVRVVPVRYGDIMPYATRLIG
ncbi:C40 family peptidase [Prauserella sp. ASG 168]|uniref:C40 family peptidase n=1 Tax=Prauserella cavernicola TaxID=2800127 RepID=A0A934QM69_9PSEU|nr:NlpC/P60 family protein [Prauserella cavernicola]MBK1782901.1 C40 family peptidase [Prauserella cavernicola]